MGMHDRSCVKGVEQHLMVVYPGTRWGATPGIIPKATIKARRAKNKAARKSRQKNR